MIAAILISIISLIPVTLGIALLRLYGRTPLIKTIFAIMLTICIWQLNHAFLFLNKQNLSEETIFLIYKITSIGPIIGIPCMYHISYLCLKSNQNNKSKNIIDRIQKLIVNKKALIALYIWSLFVYIVNLLDLQVTGLKLISSELLSTSFYLPTTDGNLKWVYVLHLIFNIFFTMIALYAMNKSEHTYIKKFMNTFITSTFMLYISGITSLMPETAYLVSAICVILYSIILVFSFIGMYNTAIDNYNKIMERQNKLDYIGNLASSLIHEVKNSLGIIQGYSQLLPQVVKLDETGEEVVSQITVASKQLSSMVRNYNLFLKNDNMEFMHENIVLVIKKAIKLMEETASKQNVTISLTNTEQNMMAYINQSSLCQVFLNLIKNSIEAIPEQNTIKKIDIDVEAVDDVININIIDSGSGIPPSKWNEIFYAFSTTKENGSGLGLIFCKKIILEHRGTISIINSSEQGTYFQIKIPRFKYNNMVSENLEIN